MALIDLEEARQMRGSKRSFIRRQMSTSRKDKGVSTKKHSPFKRKSVLGPTHKPLLRGRSSPAAPKKTRTVRQTHYWSCGKIAKYTQLCKGRKGEKMKLKKKVPYMRSLNKATKRWEKTLRHHAKKYPGGKWAKRNPGTVRG